MHFSIGDKVFAFFPITYLYDWDMTGVLHGWLCPFKPVSSSVTINLEKNIGHPKCLRSSCLSIFNLSPFSSPR